MRAIKKDSKSSETFGFIQTQEYNLRKLYEKKINFEKVKRRRNINIDEVVNQILNLIN